MKISLYFKDNLYKLLIFIICYIINLLIFLAFKIESQVIISSTILYVILYLLILLVPYFRKRKFYYYLLSNIKGLDKSYLVLETLTKPEFYEGELLYQALYEINKSMNENVKQIEEHLKGFKEYIEMWIHEVKIPLSTLILISNNQKNEFDKRVKLQIKRLENYVEQVLYYVRSENAEKDYLIKEVDLSKVIKNVGLKNMDEILLNKIDYIVESVQYKVLTDSKWLEFILDQIINNSIKYKRNISSSFIKIYVEESIEKTTLVVMDNGIGIKSADLKQVFDKSFTGENGRKGSTSTGMGLFIAKNMCEKLGHKIYIESVYNEYTKVFIVFAKNKYYDVLK